LSLSMHGTSNQACHNATADDKKHFTATTST
jgi:hypothetical protein